MWNLVSICLEIVLVSAQDRCTVCENFPLDQKSFWMHPVVLQGNEAQVEARFSHLETVLILTQDRCTVCAERTTGSEIVLDAPDGKAR
jgi:hypothetical protein